MPVGSLKNDERECRMAPVARHTSLVARAKGKGSLPDKKN